MDCEMCGKVTFGFEGKDFHSFDDGGRICNGCLDEILVSMNEPTIPLDEVRRQIDEE